jgi:DNA (cytosine-5)-methyltransferase 1
MKTLTVGSLFAGIGGIDLGLERTGGFKTVWQVEIDDYARRVLERHWPNVRRWDDVRTFPPEPIDEWRCDLICGGFPCQDISDAGPKTGIEGERSGLWSEFIRVVRCIRPRYVLVENVAAILDRGMGAVLRDLVFSGYCAEWECIPAGAFGARHFRNRVFIIATADSLLDTESEPSWSVYRQQRRETQRRLSELGGRLGETGFLWPDQPGIHRTAHGVPNRVDRHRCLGNAVVPQVAEWIGRRILEVEEKRNESASD